MARRRKWKNKPIEIREQSRFEDALKRLNRPVPEPVMADFSLEAYARRMRCLQAMIGGPVSQTGGIC
jgi:hypothetical protein